MNICQLKGMLEAVVDDPMIGLHAARVLDFVEEEQPVIDDFSPMGKSMDRARFLLVSRGRLENIRNKSIIIHGYEESLRSMERSSAERVSLMYIRFRSRTVTLLLTEGILGIYWPECKHGGPC